MAYMESLRSTAKELIKPFGHSSASMGFIGLSYDRWRKRAERKIHRLWFCNIKALPAIRYQHTHIRVCAPGQDQLPHITVNKTWFAILHSTLHYEEVCPKPLHSDAFASGRTIIVFTSNWQCRLDLTYSVKILMLLEELYVNYNIDFSAVVFIKTSMTSAKILTALRWTHVWSLFRWLNTMDGKQLLRALCSLTDRRGPI